VKDYRRTDDENSENKKKLASAFGAHTSLFHALDLGL